jgi:hypothetical protein
VEHYPNQFSIASLPAFNKVMSFENRDKGPLQSRGVETLTYGAVRFLTGPQLALKKARHIALKVTPWHRDDFWFMLPTMLKVIEHNATQHLWPIYTPALIPQLTRNARTLAKQHTCTELP